MKRAFLSVLFVLVVGLFVFSLRYELKKQAQKRRETTYQSELRLYSLALKPGMKRKEVEDYLRAKHADLTHFCCVDTSGFQTAHMGRPRENRRRRTSLVLQ
jgi:hypothetical protein